jgi:murein DD-endopeptidase MepM/ murein hydrolase activator NlpD
MTSPRPLVLAAFVALAALAAGAPVVAQTSDDLDDVQDQQDQLEDRLDVLQADYAELEDAVAATATLVRQQEAAKRAAEQRLEAAQAEVRAARAAISEMRMEIAELEDQAHEDAVQAYMNPDPNVAIMETTDLNEATRREALLTTVASRHTDVLDRLGGLEIDLVDREADARAAEAQVEDERAQVAARLADYQATLAEQQRLEDALAGRIADVQAEVAALAAEEANIRAALARASQAPPPSTPGGTIDTPPSASGLIWPVSGPVTSPFGYRWGRLHAGIDIGAPSGTPIYAANSGTVLVGCGGGYGNCVMIDHGGGFVTLYAHQTSVFVSAGQQVSRGQNIGTVGCTGSCTGPHLHFETRINGVPQDPMQYLP